MTGFTLQQLQCFDAVVKEGGFQAGARRGSGCTHPTVFSSGRQAGRRSWAWRCSTAAATAPRLTDASRSFHDKAHVFLHELKALERHAAQPQPWRGKHELRVVIGDLSPLPESRDLLRRFFDDHPATRLHLHFEALSGPWERLFDGEADLILHHIDKSDARLEFIDLFAVVLMPVAAPGFVDALASKRDRSAQVQSAAGDPRHRTATRSPAIHFLVDRGTSADSSATS